MRAPVNSETTQTLSEVQSLRDSLSRLKGKQELLSLQLKNAEQQLIENKKNIELYKQAIEVLTVIQRNANETIKVGLESIVSNALHSIYGTSYDFKIEFDRRGNYSELNFNIQTPDCKKALDPLLTSGGGVLDVISLALRVALLELSSPRIEGPLLLDESFKHLSVGYIPKAANFLKTLSAKLGRQIILVSHREELIESADNKQEIK